MSRNTLMTLLLIIVATLLAVALFVAGAIWRGRTTAPPVAAAIKGQLLATATTVEVSTPG